MPLALNEAVAKASNYQRCLLNEAQTHGKCNKICDWWLKRQDLALLRIYISSAFLLPMHISMMTCQQAPTHDKHTVFVCGRVESFRERISS